MKENLYVDFHVIQSLPPSCVNSDDTGSPKTAFYGGTMRARVSSQAWKRAMRKMFDDLFGDGLVGYRTRKVSDLVKNEIVRNNSDITADDADALSQEILEIAGVSAGGDKKSVLFFVSNLQIERIAEIAIQYQNETKTNKKKKETQYKKMLEEALKSNPSVDILLFGRMAASNPNLNYDAAAQVAHSISTHTISNEYDYFTAVDDCMDDGDAGAAHLDTTEFNSSSLYRYATINVKELSKNLTNDELKEAVRGFAEAFIRSMPTGKQNTFANRTLPDMVYVTLRTDQPANFAGAFEKPVPAGDDGYVSKSQKRLFEYASQVYENYIKKPEKSWTIGCETDDFGSKVNLKELLQELENSINDDAE